ILVFWYFGILVFWYFGILVFWYFGILVFWYFGILVFWYFGILVFWYFGILVFLLATIPFAAIALPSVSSRGHALARSLTQIGVDKRSNLPALPATDGRFR
ncbi:hypothetical protein, partial [Collimonas sp.]|uniref:hypothetical protein n=1 Tax=Collimonas sp. TaxID=1963772 RepID=UPI0037C1A2F2